MKKALCWMVAIILCLGIAPAVSAAQRGKLSLHTDAGSLTRGDVFTVTLQCNRNPGVEVMRLALSYDRQVLELREIRDMGLFPGFRSEQKDDGDILSYQEEKGKAFSLTGNVAKISFRVREDAPFGSSRISLSYSERTLDIRNTAGKAVPFDVQAWSFDLVCPHARVTRESLTPATLSADGIARVTCDDCGEVWEEPLRPEIASEDGKIRATVPSGIFSDSNPPSVAAEYYDSGDEFNAAKEEFGDRLLLAFRVRFFVSGEEVLPIGEVNIVWESPVKLPDTAALYSREEDFTDRMDAAVNGAAVSFVWRDSLLLLASAPSGEEPAPPEEEPTPSSEAPEVSTRSPEEEKRLRDAFTLAVAAGALLITGVGIVFLTRFVRKKY